VTRSAISIASDVRAGRCSALSVAQAAIDAVGAIDQGLCAVTRLLDARALAMARAVDEKVACGIDPGPLAGVPFGVKDLFDVQGLSTTAGAAMRIGAPVAERDAAVVTRMAAAGAVLVATLNMDEFAYGFATDNAHFGLTRNPHDRDRLAGGSSGGSAVAVASGMMPIALGSDTNGSVRIPASLTGCWGLKPAHGSLPMEGVFPFVDSFDDVGVFARSCDDLRLVWQVLGDEDLGTHPVPVRGGRLGGWFARNLTDAMVQSVARVCDAIGDCPLVAPSGVAQARSAAFLMTAMEGGARHLPELRRDAMGFDPATRDRLIAGAGFPHAAYLDACATQARFRAQFARLFERYDVLVAPAVSSIAPRIDEPMIMVDGNAVSARANLGLYTQPISFIGLPVIAAPVRQAAGVLPMGVQLIGRPGGEGALLALAAELERQGVLAAGMAEDIAA
jgi:aspartyl-tRNA(Asn)/glutamyl-tRNA(Gln) amidotransferase subunit A